ncbi:MAG: hypothetical protein ACK4OM_06515, partial [Alphaproteobacteria bacterium]
MRKILYLLALIMISNPSFAVKDCPGDLVLWKQPGSTYSDCQCPYGNSLVAPKTNGSSVRSFGKCTDSNKILNRKWAKNIHGDIALWLDAYDPFDVGYIPTNSYAYSTWIDKSYTYGDGSISGGYI